MSEKKNIDRLFQEKFKDFEAVPPEHVWENIEAELKEKKKRRVIPLWFKLGGAAAVLLLGMWLINPFDNEIEVNNAPVVNSNNTDNNTNSKANNNSDNDVNSINTPANGKQNFGNNQDAIVVDDNKKSDTDNSENPSITNGGSNQNNVGNRKKNDLGNNRDAVVSNNANKTNSNPNNTNAKSRIGTKNERRNNNTEYLQNQEGVAYTHKTENNRTNNNSNNVGNNQNTTNGNGNNTIKTDVVPDEEFGIAQNENELSNNSTDAENGAEQNRDNIIIDKENVLPIPEEAFVETAVDTTTTEEPENELEKLWQEKLKEKEKKEEMLAENDNNNKWNIKPQVAPVFYNSLSEGSPIDAQFAGNSKKYNNNLSYGVGIDYALNDRISIRSGINTVNLSYSTRGVEFYASMSQQTNNISSNSAARTANFVVQNESAPTNDIGLHPAASTQTFNGSMLQEMGYIEVPLEMSYALLNKKFGIDVIGGFSTLFLNDNNVSVVTTQGLSSSLGEAENLNNIHFSTNVGIGFKYKFFKSFQASFEPTFKYQINTFSGNSGNFKPYFIGLYSGVSFSF